MDQVLNKIYHADAKELDILRTALLQRYRQIYPDWDIHLLSLYKKEDTGIQLDRLIVLLESLKNSGLLDFHATIKENGKEEHTMLLHQGRPENCHGRLEKEIRCYDLLDRLGIDYQRIDHEKADTMEICAALDASLGALICKNLLLCNRQCTDFYMLMMPAEKPFKTKNLSKQIGSSRLSFADGAYMEQFLDITPGSLSVLGLMNDRENRVRLLIDRDVLRETLVGCHPCINTSSVRLAVADLMQKLLPAMGHEATIVDLPWETEAPAAADGNTL